MKTIKELDALADQFEKEGMVDNAMLTGAKATPGEIITGACKLYKKVVPFLEIYTSLFFIPAKWKTPVQTFMVFMNGLCPA
jgi:hypothetical protein